MTINTVKKSYDASRMGKNSFILGIISIGLFIVSTLYCLTEGVLRYRGDITNIEASGMSFLVSLLIASLVCPWMSMIGLILGIVGLKSVAGKKAKMGIILCTICPAFGTVLVFTGVH